jgi:hypothetical protein
MLCLLSVATGAQTEHIRDFRSDIHLLDDGTLLVKETITVFSTGNLIRHGIYRGFPTHKFFRPRGLPALAGRGIGLLLN